MTSPVDLLSAERRKCGHVIVLPGIEGYSRWNRSIVRGLEDAQVLHAMEIHDWTYGRWLSPVSLRSNKLHQEQSRVIAEKVLQSREEYPGAPIWLIGHSGGGAMAVLSLEQLPDDVRIAGAILLAPALSPGYALRAALSRTERGMWNFRSWGDLFFLALGTVLLGTVDGRHTVSAGARGFQSATDIRVDGECETGDHPQLHEIAWRPGMVSERHLGGHFGCVHRLFVSRRVAPILLGEGDTPKKPATNAAGTLL